ncbi:hypothetical protein SAY87_002874 [Trapa incisa]|uniref:WEB family protein n=1 Tax=Trapa incisa TaxID=236973 RepID=A0AAN7QI88_9MYRT|nr:hypothetical protein SAY87_002874 [Trapa incisa]
MSSKSKSGLSETPTSKASVTTPRVSRISRSVAKSEADSPSSLQNARPSVDRSPRSVTSRPSIDRRSPRVIAPADKPAAKAGKGSDLQSQLNHLQEDLKTAKEKVALIEEEKEKALDELKEAHRLVEGANEKLRDALVAQKRAEESSEIEKFRAIEMEQVEIEAAQKKEEEWMKELESERNQHALDVAALLSTTQDLQKAQLDLAMACDAKNQALSHAEDATRIAEIHAEKVEILRAELTSLKASLDSRLEAKANENNKIVLQLKEEAESLRQELRKAKIFEQKLSETEASFEQLNIELEGAKMAESYAYSLTGEWKNKVEDLEKCVAEANKLERSASESLHSMMEKMEQNNDSLQRAESEVVELKEKIGALEITIGKQKNGIRESELQLSVVSEEKSEMAKIVEALKVEIERLEEEKLHALNCEKLAVSNIQSLSEEKDKLMSDLKIAKEEEEKNKKAMESLASALHEVSAEARDANEKFLCIQHEHGTCEGQMENLTSVLKETNEKYETMLHDARHEVDLLASATEKSKIEYENAKSEWEQKELHLMDCLKKLEVENNAIQIEKDKLVNLLEQTEEEAHARKEEESRLKVNLKKVEDEVGYLQGSLGEAKVETMKLKESLLDKEEELQMLLQENEELKASEAANFNRIEELSKLLEEANAKNQPVENGDLTDTEKEYDLLPKVVEFSEENGHGGEEKHKVETQPHDKCRRESLPERNNDVNDEGAQVGMETKIDGIDEKKEEGNKEQENDSVEVEYKMWESCQIEKKEVSPEREAKQESIEEELDSKVNDSKSSENMEGGGTSPSKQHSSKKKRPLLQKFGSLLKKKGGASNTK